VLLRNAPTLSECGILRIRVNQANSSQFKPKFCGNRVQREEKRAITKQISPKIANFAQI